MKLSHIHTHILKYSYIHTCVQIHIHLHGPLKSIETIHRKESQTFKISRDHKLQRVLRINVTSHYNICFVCFMYVSIGAHYESTPSVVIIALRCKSNLPMGVALGAHIFDNTPHHTAAHGNTLQHTKKNCITLQQHSRPVIAALGAHTFDCNTLQHTSSHYSTRQHTASRYKHAHFK